MARIPRLFWTLSNSFLSPLQKNPIAADIIVLWIIWDGFLFILILVCCVYSIESPRWGDSNETHTIYLQVRENCKDILIMPLDLALWLTLISSNYPCPEHIWWFQRCSSDWSSSVQRSGGGVVDNTLDYQSRDRMIDPPLLWSFGWDFKPRSHLRMTSLLVGR